MSVNEIKHASQERKQKEKDMGRNGFNDSGLSMASMMITESISSFHTIILPHLCTITYMDTYEVIL